MAKGSAQGDYGNSWGESEGDQVSRSSHGSGSRSRLPDEVFEQGTPSTAPTSLNATAPGAKGRPSAPVSAAARSGADAGSVVDSAVAERDRLREVLQRIGELQAAVGGMIAKAVSVGEQSRAGECDARSPRDYVCNEQSGHFGLHIARADGYGVVDAWTGGDTPAEIAARMLLGADILLEASSLEGLPSGESWSPDGLFRLAGRVESRL